MYSADWIGKFPERLELLTPKYLKTIPVCPSSIRQNHVYQTGKNVGYSKPGFEDYFFLYSQGKNHVAVSVPVDYPQYDGVSGLISR